MFQYKWILTLAPHPHHSSSALWLPLTISRGVLFLAEPRSSSSPQILLNAQRGELDFKSKNQYVFRLQFHISLMLFFLDSLWDRCNTQIRSEVKKKKLAKLKSEHHIIICSPLTNHFCSTFPGQNADQQKQNEIKTTRTPPSVILQSSFQ